MIEMILFSGILTISEKKFVNFEILHWQNWNEYF